MNCKLNLSSNKVIENISSNPPLSNVQAELIKLFRSEIPDEYLLELKKVMAKFLFEKARDKADAIWDAKKYSDEYFQQLP